MLNIVSSKIETQNISHKTCSHGYLHHYFKEKLHLNISKLLPILQLFPQKKYQNLNLIYQISIFFFFLVMLLTVMFFH
jgi:hypothetical protein